MLVFFGFTHCPDICPAELQIMSAVLEDLGNKADKVVPIFISVDPERDTPEALRAYLKNFSPRILGLTGSPEVVAAAAKAYRVVYSKVDQRDSAGDYTVDHTALIYLMGPDGQYLTHFAYGMSAADMVKGIRRYF
jgi:protein SCO1/2